MAAGQYHQEELEKCKACPNMIAAYEEALGVDTDAMLIGQVVSRACACGAGWVVVKKDNGEKEISPVGWMSCERAMG